MRLDDAPERPPVLATGSSAGDGETGAVALDALIDRGAGGWRTYAVPIACFEAGGAALASVDAPFRMTVTGPASLSLSRVALGSDYDVLTDGR